MPRPSRTIVIQHEDDAPAGLLGDWLIERLGAYDVVDATRDLRGVSVGPDDLVVSLGSEHHAYDEELAWVPQERALLADVAAQGTAVFGVCFGAQMLASALGGKVLSAELFEVGWHTVDPKPGVPIHPGPWFQWHFDRFEVPEGAELLATSPACPQAFRLGRAIGVQFHPEVTPYIVADWIDKSRGHLTARQLDGDAIFADTEREHDAARERASTLFDALIGPLIS
jgi:GMP synthase-like glutamine amidotransferase